MKHRATATFLLLLIISAAFFLKQVGIFNKTDVYTACRRTLDKSHDELIVFIRTHQGEYIDKDHEAFKAISSLFEVELTSVDLRSLGSVVFSFHSTLPSTSLQLIYHAEDQFTLQPNTILTEDINELRLEHLGIKKTGYIDCKRIKKHWFYYEAFLPT